MTKGSSLWRGSGMLSSVAVVDETSTSTRDVPGIHMASRYYHILEADEAGVYLSAQFQALCDTCTVPAPASHVAHFKSLSDIPRSKLALTTCHALTAKPCYTCAGAGINPDSGESSFYAATYLTPDYLTSKIYARYPKLAKDDRNQPYAGQLLDFKLSRSEFVVDCNAATVEICNQVEKRCQPFLCKQEVKTNKGLVEAFGIAFANYGLATAVLMPLFALLAARIGRKPAGAAGETTVSVSEKI